MKTTQTSVTTRRRKLFRRARAAHDPWLVLNLGLFNYGDYWSRLLLKQQLQQLGR